MAAAALAATVSSCTGAGSAHTGRLRVVTTVSPVTNLVHNVGGERVDLVGLVPEGTNSHTFEPAPSHARSLGEADIVFVNGLHLEQPTIRLAEDNVGEGVEIVALGERTISRDDYIYDFSFPRSEGDPNPHLWTNPLYAKRYARIAAEELARLDPGGTAYYRGNYRHLAAHIDQLDHAARAVTKTVPADDRKLLTYHDSFPYFAREYGWEVIGAIQPSDLSEPTARSVAELIDQIRKEDVTAIFGSEVFPSPVLEQIADETGARYIDDLRDDDLPGEPGARDHSYLGLMVFDFKTFMGALGGDVGPLESLFTGNLAGEGSATYRE